MFAIQLSDAEARDVLDLIGDSNDPELASVANKIESLPRPGKGHEPGLIRHPAFPL